MKLIHIKGEGEGDTESVNWLDNRYMHWKLTCL